MCLGDLDSTLPHRIVVLSIQTGMPRTLGEEGAKDPMDRRWTTGFCKTPVNGPVQLSKTKLDGDGQADQVNHGGPDKAVLAYSAVHYDDWRTTLDRPELPFGAFGENFTIQGSTESDVCIGDTWEVGGDVLLQISQPRQPCWKLARRWRIKSLALQVQQTGRTGWYYRVLKEGTVAAGMPLRLEHRPHPSWTVQRANQVMHAEKSDLQSTLELAALPLLSESWRITLTRRAEKLDPDTNTRLVGDNDG